MAEYQLGDYGAAQTAYTELQKIAPEPAGKHPYLTSGPDNEKRNASAGDGESPKWSGE